MTMADPTLRARPRLALPLMAALLLGAPQTARAMPFDPLPSAFERWLNSQRDWPQAQRLRFSGLGQCSDQSAASSPYRMPVYTCLQGEVRSDGGDQPSQVCRLKRVSYFPGIRRVRYWTESCKAAG